MPFNYGPVAHVRLQHIPDISSILSVKINCCSRHCAVDGFAEQLQVAVRVGCNTLYKVVLAFVLCAARTVQ
eukprot:16590-Heterococcus_DN1.PRE.3